MSVIGRDGIFARLPGGSPRSLLDELARVGTALAKAGRARPDVELYLTTGPILRGRIIAVAEERGGAVAQLHIGGSPTSPSITYVRAEHIIAVTVTDASLLVAAPLADVPAPGRLDLQRQLATRAEALTAILGRTLPLTVATDLDDDGRRAVAAVLPILAEVLSAIASDDMGKAALAPVTTLELAAAPALEIARSGTGLILRAPTLLTAQLDHAQLRAALEKLL